MLSELNDIFEDVKNEDPYKELVTGEYVGTIAEVKYDPDKKWRDGTVVPQLSMRIQVTEGEFEGTNAFVNFNLGGRTVENARIGLSVFVQTLRRLELDIDEMTLEEVIEESANAVDLDVKFKVAPQKKNPEYMDTTIIGLC